MAQNDITATILDSGAVRIDTDQIAGPAHQAAEKALLWIAQELGGETTRTSRKGHAHTHAHEHTHDTEHGTITHSH